MLEIQAIPHLQDNYCWAVKCHNTQTLIDPGEAQPILSWLNQQTTPLVSVMITHHHQDHWGGVEALLKTYPNCQLYISNGQLYPASFQSAHKLTAGSNFIDPSSQINWRIWAAPGHTLDHLAFSTDGHLFCGDVLFSAGCGRLFEGDAAMLFQSIKNLCTLPDDTFVYAGHEYTLDNLRFAQAIEPHNRHIQVAIADGLNKQQQHTPSLPTTLAHEKKVNPFLRCHLPSVQTQVAQLSQQACSDELSTFTQLRILKDNGKIA